MIIEVCVGSACHLKGSPEIVQLMQNAIVANALERQVTLAGSFCLGKCSPTGVTVKIDEEVFTGINRINFNEFFQAHVLDALKPDTAHADLHASVPQRRSSPATFRAS